MHLRENPARIDLSPHSFSFSGENSPFDVTGGDVPCMLARTDNDILNNLNYIPDCALIRENV